MRDNDENREGYDGEEWRGQVRGSRAFQESRLDMGEKHSDLGIL